MGCHRDGTGSALLHTDSAGPEATGRTARQLGSAVDGHLWDPQHRGVRHVVQPTTESAHSRGNPVNFGRVHQTLRVTPAMEAGVSDHVWSAEEIVALLG